MEFRSQPIRMSPLFPLRRVVTGVGMAVLLAVLALRLGWLTLVQGTALSQAAEENLNTPRRLEAPRGNILDRSGTPIATNRRSYSVSYSRYGQKSARVHETLRRTGELLGIDLLAREQAILDSRPSWKRHAVARHLRQGDVVAILERPDDFPGVRVDEEYVREYNGGPALGLVVGHLGQVQAEERDRYPAPTYLSDSAVGRDGIERQYEARLVGKPGSETLRRDARGRFLSDPLLLRRAVAGDDVVLCIDSVLQQRAMELLAGHNGSAILMDCTNGELLVLASFPTYDPAHMELQEVMGATASYFLRAVRGSYAPGSTFKVATALAVLRSGIPADRRLRCTGSFTPLGWTRPFYCDARSGHGPVDLVTALKVSCNGYFYEAGTQVGAAAVEEAARSLGFGRVTGIDLPGERAGQLPAPSRVNAGELLNISIGQGALVCTPVQMARAYAALANGGTLVVPHVVREIRPGDGSAAIPFTTTGTLTLALSAGQRSVLNRGLHEAVNDQGGTAFRAGFDPAWGVCGKTSTSENSREKNDAWFAGYYPESSPRWVVLVMVEDTEGHGGEIAAPLARQLVAAHLGAPPAPVAMSGQ